MKGIARYVRVNHLNMNILSIFLLHNSSGIVRYMYNYILQLTSVQRNFDKKHKLYLYF